MFVIVKETKNKHSCDIQITEENLHEDLFNTYLKKKTGTWELICGKCLKTLFSKAKAWWSLTLFSAILTVSLSISWSHPGGGAQTSYGGCGLWRHSELQVVWKPSSHPHLDQEGLQYGENKQSKLTMRFKGIV